MLSRYCVCSIHEEFNRLLHVLKKRLCCCAQKLFLHVSILCGQIIKCVFESDMTCIGPCIIVYVNLRSFTHRCPKSFQVNECFFLLQMDMLLSLLQAHSFSKIFLFFQPLLFGRQLCTVPWREVFLEYANTFFHCPKSNLFSDQDQITYEVLTDEESTGSVFYDSRGPYSCHPTWVSST